MPIVLATHADAGAELLVAHIAFHLAAGADTILISGVPASTDLGVWEAHDRVRRVEGATHTDLARLAVAEHAADWIIPGRADEFWWPRGENLADVLAVIPPRYSVVQALVRTFVGSRGGGDRFAEEMTIRTSLSGPRDADNAPVAKLLQPVYRAEPDMVIDSDDRTLRERRVPLRAWYPLELLRFPAEPIVAPSAVEARLADGTLIVDTRLRELLRSLRMSSESVAPVAFPVPNVVDDAAYAIECAAVGEVDLAGVDRQIRELELRIAALESRFWPTVHRGLRRLARRRS